VGSASKLVFLRALRGKDFSMLVEMAVINSA